MTTKTKTKPKRARKAKSTYPIKYPIEPEEPPAFYAQAMTLGGRFVLAGVLLRAAVSVLVRGKALV
jgi:hypothetical protein